MKLVVAVCVLFLAASSQAGPRRTFPNVTSFSKCHRETECGLSAHGGFESHGQYKVCERYTFHPDGSYTREHQDWFEPPRGRYRVVGRTVRLTPLDDRGRAQHTRVLTLSRDGTTLDGFAREPARHKPRTPS